MYWTSKGYVIEFDLAKFGHENYAAECIYLFNKEVDKYSLTMNLRRTDLGGKMKIESKGIDTQYISGDQSTIRQNISKIVWTMGNSGYFDEYVKAYETEVNGVNAE